MQVPKSAGKEGEEHNACWLFCLAKKWKSDQSPEAGTSSSPTHARSAVHLASCFRPALQLPGVAQAASQKLGIDEPSL
eukprot:3330557-Amphidinium_carterae.1